MSGKLKRRWFQFSIRSLLLASIMTITLFSFWWSHRLHCLERSDFHRQKREWCSEKQVQLIDESEAEYIADYIARQNNTRVPSLRWEDQSLEDSIRQGYLITPTEDYAPRNSPTVETPHSPSTLANSDASLLQIQERLRVLGDRSRIHDHLRSEYLRAIYRPWMTVDEPQLEE